MATSLLRLEAISKSFPGVQALADVNLELKAGEILAICGENGAGKSTLMKMLGGHYRPDHGHIFLNGREMFHSRPLDARKAGILLVHQEISLVPDLSVAENIFMGRLPKGRFGTLDKKRLRRDAQAVLDRFDYDIDPDQRAGELSIAQMQMVEVARAAAFTASVVVFDEPTASLTDKEAAALFEVIASLKAQGVGIIYISHRMEEIFAISDRISVLRDGRIRGTINTVETDEQEVTALMIGRVLEMPLAPREAKPGREVLRLDDFSRAGDFEGISLSVRAGEVVGLYGLVGAGRSELAETVFGMRAPDKGKSIVWEGAPVTVRAPSDAIALGIGLVPESRKDQGLVLGMDCRQNLTLGWLPSVSSGGVLQKGREAALYRQFAADLSISSPRPDRPVERLSGGNQQKIVIAKWLNKTPKLLILDEPTRGIDVGSKAAIHHLISRLADDGVAVLVISSDMPEIMRISDRVLTMHHGHITGEFSGDAITESNLIGGATAGQRLVA